MLYTKKQFGALVGIKTKDLSNYIKRRKLITTADGIFLDTEDDLNRAFLIHMGVEAAPPEIPALEEEPARKEPSWAGREDELLAAQRRKAVKPKVEKPAASNPLIDPDADRKELQKRLAEMGIKSFAESEQVLKHWQAQKVEMEAELKQLDFDRKMGNLIPAGTIGNIISQLSRSFTAAFRQVSDGMADRYTVKYKINARDAADLRKHLVAAINNGIEAAVKDAKKAVASIAKESAK